MSTLNKLLIFFICIILLTGCTNQVDNEQSSGTTPSTSVTTTVITTTTVTSTTTPKTTTTTAISKPIGSLLDQAIAIVKARWNERIDQYYTNWNQETVTFDAYYVYENDEMLFIAVEFSDTVHYGNAYVQESPDTGNLMLGQYTLSDVKLDMLGEAREENIEYEVLVPGGILICIRKGNKITIARR